HQLIRPEPLLGKPSDARTCRDEVVPPHVRDASGRARHREPTRRRRHRRVVGRTWVVSLVTLVACTGASLPARVTTPPAPEAAVASIGGPPPVVTPIDVSDLEGRIVFSSE